MMIGWIGGTKTQLTHRLKTQQDCEQLERKLHEAERELETERRRLVELENRLSDLQDGVSLASFSRSANDLWLFDH